MKMFVSSLLILCNIHQIYGGYMFDIPEDGQYKDVTDHNFLKEYRKSLEDSNLKQAYSKSIYNTMMKQDGKNTSTTKRDVLRMAPEKDMNEVIKTETGGHLLSDLSGGLFNEGQIDNVVVHTENRRSKFIGKLKNDQYLFWLIKGSDFSISLDVGLIEDSPSFTFATTEIVIEGEFLSDNVGIKVEIKKEVGAEIYSITKFETVDTTSIKDIKEILHGIQFGISGTNFFNSISYIQATVIDDMKWKKFKGFGTIKRDGFFTLFITSVGATLADYSASMQIVIQGAHATEASNYGFLANMNDVEINVFWSAINTRGKDNIITLGRIDKTKTWCLAVSSSSFSFTPSLMLQNEFKITFKDCYLEEGNRLKQQVTRDSVSKIEFELQEGTYFKVHIIPVNHFLSCGGVESPSTISTGRDSVKITMMIGQLGPTGVTWSLPHLNKISFDVIRECLESYVSDWNVGVIEMPEKLKQVIGKVTITDFFKNDATGYLAAGMLYTLQVENQKMFPDFLPEYSKRLFCQLNTYKQFKHKDNILYCNNAVLNCNVFIY